MWKYLAHRSVVIINFFYSASVGLSLLLLLFGCRWFDAAVDDLCGLKGGCWGQGKPESLQGLYSQEPIVPRRETLCCQYSVSDDSDMTSVSYLAESSRVDDMWHINYNQLNKSGNLAE